MPSFVLILLLGAIVLVGLVLLFTGVQRLATWRFQRQFPFEVGPSLRDSAFGWVDEAQDDTQVAQLIDLTPTESTGTNAPADIDPYRP